MAKIQTPQAVSECEYSDLQESAGPAGMAREEVGKALDVSRPHTLLTKSVEKSDILQYRYNDTGEILSVQNVWYNQPFDVRAASLARTAQILTSCADEFEKRSAASTTTGRPLPASSLARSYLSRARMIRSEVLRILAAGSPVFPVAASRLPLSL